MDSEAASHSSAFEPLNAIRHLKVSRQNPPTSSEEHGLDFERCSELHNAIVRHAWLANGYSLTDLPTTTWWQRPENEPHHATLEQYLEDPLIEFLKRALVPGFYPEGTDRHSFFYGIHGLFGAKQLIKDLYECDEDRLALYSTDTEISEEFEGFIYDYSSHLCVYNERDASSLHPLITPVVCWQRLETVLSVWIEMIERGKVVALDKTMKSGNTIDKDPWSWVSYSTKDLEETLQAWHELIQAIKDKLPPTNSVQSHTTKGLFEEDTLKSAGVREGGFAWQFYTNAQKPDFRFLGPGLSVPLPEQLLANPFKLSHNASPPGSLFRPEVFPLPILVGERRAKPWIWHHRDQIAPVPWGVYLDYCQLEYLTPFEDGSVVALPYDLDGSACKLNGTPACGNTELYQIGWNSFVPKHSTQLLTVLRNFTSHVTNGQWRVGSDGVDEPDTKFTDIDWDEKWYWDGDGHLEILAHVVEGIYGGAWKKVLDEH